MKLYYVFIGLLLVMVVVLIFRIIQYKRQMRIFAHKISKYVDEDYNQTINVEYFDKDIIKLANALNKYIQEIRLKNVSLENDRRKLKSVIAGISHDFRTPLTAAKGYLQLIKKNGKISDKDMEYLDIALSKTDYLKVLSDAFFQVSSLEAKDEAVEIVDVDVAKLLTNYGLEQYEWIKESQIVIKFEIPERAVWVKGNEGALDRIIGNLFSNARKYAKSEINVALFEKNETVFVVFSNDIESDNEIDANCVFDAFYRGNSRQKEGAGLGLYVVKCLADKMEYEVEATVDNCRFVITLVIKNNAVNKS